MLNLIHLQTLWPKPLNITGFELKSLFKISHHTTWRGSWKKKRKSKNPNTHYSSTMAFVLFLTLQRALNHLLYYNPTEKPVFLSTSKGNQGFFKKKQIWHQTQDNTKLSSTKLQFPRIEKSQCFSRSNFFTAELSY